MAEPRGRVAGALRLLVAYGAVALTAAFVTIRVTARGSSATVPPLAGLDIAQCRQLLAGRGLEYLVTGEEWSEQQPAGMVLSQAPAPNARVKRGRRVRLVLSRGSEIIQMPQLRDMPLDAAEFTLRQLGLELAQTAAAPAPAAKRTVLSQNPPPGERVPRGRPVQLLVSDGPAAASFMIPRVVGMPTRDALTRLREAGLRIAEVAYEATTLFADGTVFAQDPPGGFRTVIGEESHLKAARAGASTGLTRYVSFNFVVPDGPARRIKVLIVDEGGSRELMNDVEEGNSVQRFSTQVQGQAVAQLFVSGALIEERPL